MKIWLIDPYCTIPGEGWRHSRYTMIGEEMARRGHKVVWWTATFSHQFKCFRGEGWTWMDVADGFRIKFVPATSYARNISFSRLAFEASFSLRLYRRLRSSVPPDCIIAREPSQFGSCAGVQLARRFQKPVIIDVFDLWPELFVVALPRRLRSLGKVLFAPLYWLRRYNLKHADGCVAVCNSYLTWVQSRVPEIKGIPCNVIFIGVDVEGLRGGENVLSTRPMAQQRVGKPQDEVWVIYAGTLGEHYDILTLIKAACLLKTRGMKVRIYIAGDGPGRSAMIRQIQRQHLDNVNYLGVLGSTDLWAQYRVCDMAICPYSGESTVAIPVKVYDYFAAGLPVINSLQGELALLIRNNRAGLQYVGGDCESMAEAVEKMALNPTDLREMSANSYDIAMKFDKALQYGRLGDFVETVASKSATALRSMAHY